MTASATGSIVWVLVRHNSEHQESDVVAVTPSLDAAEKAADVDYGPGRSPLEWLQNHDGSWTTSYVYPLHYTADEWLVTSTPSGASTRLLHTKSTTSTWTTTNATTVTSPTKRPAATTRNARGADDRATHHLCPPVVRF